MRVSPMVVAATIFFTCWAVAGVAAAAATAGREPASAAPLPLPGEEPPGTLPPPAPEAQPAAAPLPNTSPLPAAAATKVPAPPPAPDATGPEAQPGGREDYASWGVLARGGYFGLPDFIADELFVKHPVVEGSFFGAEIRYHGTGGGRGIASLGIGIESATAQAAGVWQEKKTDTVTIAEGDIRMLAVTLTGYWSLFPSWYVHPYFGLGIGVARMTGYYEDQLERIDFDYWIPAVHVPIGLAIEFGEHFQLAAEARFLDGVALGGALQLRF